MQAGFKPESRYTNNMDEKIICFQQKSDNFLHLKFYLSAFVQFFLITHI